MYSTTPNFSRTAIILLIAAGAFVLLGVGMRAHREVFEPILREVLPFVFRRTHAQYDPAHYQGYAMMPYVAAGVSLALSAFAAMFKGTAARQIDNLSDDS